MKDKTQLFYELEKLFRRENFCVFLDVSLMSAMEKDTVQLIRICLLAHFCVIALSSGSGEEYSHIPRSHLYNSLLKCTRIEFCPFNKTESIAFIAIMKSNTTVLSKDAAEKLFIQYKPFAGRNPYLLYLALREDSIAKSYGACYRATRHFAENTLPKIECDDRFIEHMNDIALTFHFAKNGIWMRADFYYRGFVQDHCLAYVSCSCMQKDAEYVKVKLNYPLLPHLLRSYLHRIAMLNSTPINVSKLNNSVKGYLVEAEFFTFTSITVSLSPSSTSPEHVQFLCHVEQEHHVLCALEKGILYQLRINHPIIDAVGLLHGNGKWWLVFVQVSVQSYINHSSKLADLFAHKRGCKGYKELKASAFASSSSTSDPLSLFDYYKGLCQKSDIAVEPSQIVYFYASTSTIYGQDTRDISQLNEHAQGRCMIGLLSAQSDLYKALIKYL